MSFRYILAIFIFTIITFLVMEEVNAQCVMCKAIVESGNELGQNETGKGLNQGILYIMGIPYLLLLVGGVLLFKKVKQKN